MNRYIPNLEHMKRVEFQNPSGTPITSVLNTPPHPLPPRTTRCPYDKNTMTIKTITFMARLRQDVLNMDPSSSGQASDTIDRIEHLSWEDGTHMLFSYGVKFLRSLYKTVSRSRHHKYGV